MSRSTSESVLQMRQGYVELHNRGCSVQEIADQFGLSPTTVYSNLGMIAEAAGVPRESLLQIPDMGIPHTTSIHGHKPLAPIDPATFNDHATSALAEIDALIQAISADIAKLDTTDEEENPNA